MVARMTWRHVDTRRLRLRQRTRDYLRIQSRLTEKMIPIGDADVDRWLTKIHVNCGHVHPTVLAQCLREA
eukprot:2263953-Lingulodinium_polyedra.AAC.1